jgi:regulator of replication initiation timing
MEHAKHVIEEWNTTIVPKIIPKVESMLQQVTDMKHQIDSKENNVMFPNDRAKDVIHAELGIIFDETMHIEKQIQKLYDRLHTCKGQIHDALEGNPLCTKYLSPIVKLPIFGRVSNKTEQQEKLDHYYQHDFLHQYETATLEYQTVTDQCQHILLLVSNSRTSLKA